MFVGVTALMGPLNTAKAEEIDRWIHPGPSHDPSSCDICGIDTDEHVNEQNYNTVLQSIDVFQFFIGDLGNLGADHPQQLRTRVGIYRRRGIRISAEDLGLNDKIGDSTYCEQPDVLKDFASVAHASARRTLSKLQSLYDAGGRLDYLRAR